MKKKVSVIVPCYNVEKYIDKCINSIVVQTYDNLEIILINDGSIDLTEEKCNEWAKKDKRIRVINKEHEGTVRARKTGIRMATGAYACYVDSDDWIDSCMIERLLHYSQESGHVF